MIATEEQFQGFDTGAAKVVLQPEDIPASGVMQGLLRLEVIAPQTAAKLAALSDAGLAELLPPAPVDARVPVDESEAKWFEVMKPMMSQASDRGVAHLRAFVEYAGCAEERALFAAQTASDSTALRAAVTDWIYWQHVGVLTGDALLELQPT
ncbi:hypothetical protein [Micromonospora sp. WMMD736]|uniref:hypothetical protein n=1 Tax=Micromonospora sp. WMMD736 TaxID=3404112 RepID=UPI003B923EA0